MVRLKGQQGVVFVMVLVVVFLLLVFITDIVTIAAMEQAKNETASTAILNFVEAMNIIYLVIYSVLLISAAVLGRVAWRAAERNDLDFELSANVRHTTRTVRPPQKPNRR